MVIDLFIDFAKSTFAKTTKTQRKMPTLLLALSMIYL